MPIYAPTVMYDLRLFIVVLQELQCLPNCLHVCIIRVIGLHHFTRFRCSKPSSFLYCLRVFLVVVFYKNYIVYHNVYSNYIH